jgi:hypothetical protein
MRKSVVSEQPKVNLYASSRHRGLNKSSGGGAVDTSVVVSRLAGKENLMHDESSGDAQELSRSRNTN